MTQHLVVVGGGMVAQRLVEALRDRDAAGDVAGHRLRRGAAPALRPRRAHRYFSGRDADDLALGDPALWDDPLVTLVRDDARGRSIDREARTVTTDARADRALRPPRCSPPARRRGCRRSRAHDLPGVFVYRTVDDVAALRG